MINYDRGLACLRNGRFDEARLEHVLAMFPVLRQKWQQAAGGLSGGQKQMLAVSRAMVEQALSTGKGGGVS